MKKTNTEPASKTEYVYNEIRERILDGRYSPGFRLVLSSLAEEYSMSTVPVREAIRWLEAEELVEYKHNSGAMVSRVDITSYGESMAILAYLEGVATASSAPYLTEGMLRKAERLNQEMDAIIRAEHFDAVAWRELNSQFHTLLYSACKNKRLKELIFCEAERVQRVRRSSFEFNAQRSAKSVEQHAELIRLIREGAPGLKIELFARQHKLSTYERLTEDTQ
ncbi:MAG: GntR family transcriptional regulator [Actinomycetaceae bacterium]|nr:GntR family transcriptional regulator [Actinomycetaceae bacterium]